MRKFSGMLLMIVLALVLAACGGDDDETEPTTEATVPVVSTEAADGDATAQADDAAVTNDATPASAASPAVAASPPTGATPAALASPAVGATPGASPVAATPVLGGAAGVVPATTMTLSGTVILPGEENDAFILSDDGCVGLGKFSDLQVGRQVVVRDEGGAIIGVTRLEATDSIDSCIWAFALEIPESEFYSVSVPMTLEHIFTSEEIEQGGGEVVIPLG